MQKKEKISLIIPCYNEEEVLPILYQEINKVSKELENVIFELIFIDDGSKDKTLNFLKKIAKKDERVRYISFSRNFGKEAAMYAGLKNITGDYAAIMDADMQDPPEMLKIMYHYIKEENYDCVALYTKSHDEYGIIRQVADSITNMPEYNRYTKGIFGFIGYRTKWIEYNAPNREAGTSKFNIYKLMKYALEGIVSFSTKPLILAAYTGILFCLMAFLTIIVIIGKTIIWGDPVSGWPSLACLIVFIGGIQLFFLGIIGIYLSKIYLEIKNRPVYIVKETEKDNYE